MRCCIASSTTSRLKDQHDSLAPQFWPSRGGVKKGMTETV
jgi:hypothetical protein